MDFNELAEKRYSCKKYDGSKKVEPAVLEKILEAGRLAPTAKNLQEQKIYVLESEAALSKMDSLTPCRYGAPVVLMVAYDSANVFTYPGNQRDSGVEDATIVATHLMLSAADNNVDSCWINFFDPAKAKETFGLPANEEVLMFLDLGFAAEGAKPLPNHTSRKPIEQTVKHL